MRRSVEKPSDDPTVRCCLDADRLDLARISRAFRPGKKLMSTLAWPDVLEWAVATLDDFTPWPQLAADAGYGPARR